MLRTNDHRAEAPPAPPAATAGGDPLLQLQHELQPPTGPRVYRYIRHPQVLALRGIPVMCTACRARRDWLLINEGRNVFIQCRCNNRWHENVVATPRRGDEDTPGTRPADAHRPVATPRRGDEARRSPRPRAAA